MDIKQPTTLNIDNHCFITGKDALKRQLKLIGLDPRNKNESRIVKVDFKSTYILSWSTKGAALEPIYTDGSRFNTGCKIYHRSNTKIYNPFEFLQEKSEVGMTSIIINPVKIDCDQISIGKTGIKKAKCFFVELDYKLESQWENLKNFVNTTNLEPSLIVFSGNKSLHVYWELKNYIPIGIWEPIQKKLCFVLQGDPDCVTPDTQLKIAGLKRNNGYQQAIHYRSSNIYQTPDINAGLSCFDWLPEKMSNKTWTTCQKVIRLTNTQADRSAETLKKAYLAEATKKPKKKENSTQATYSHLNNKKYQAFCENTKIPTDTQINLIAVVSSNIAERLNGVVQGGRNRTAYAVASELIATENLLKSWGQNYEGNAHGIYLQFCQACDPTDWFEPEWESIWRSAENRNPEPTQSEETIRHKILAATWHKKKRGTTPTEKANKKQITKSKSKPRFQTNKSLNH